MALWARYEGGFGIVTDDQVVPHHGGMFGVSEASGTAMALTDLKRLAPVTPGKFIGLRNNFHALADKFEQAIP